jgi:hypothetical protein
MAEFPLVQEWQADAVREALTDLLKDRFQSLPADLDRQLQGVRRLKALKQLILIAAKSPDLDTFWKEPADRRIGARASVNRDTLLADWARAAKVSLRRIGGP